MKSDLPYIGHIIDSITAIETYVSSGRDAFLREQMIQDAVIRNFEIIGEAANRLSPDLKSQANIPWAKIIAFRNRLIYGYWSVDPFLVRDAVINELPQLKREVLRLRGEFDQPHEHPDQS